MEKSPTHSLSPVSSPSRKNWNKLFNVMVSVNLFRKNEVSILDSLVLFEIWILKKKLKGHGGKRITTGF